MDILIPFRSETPKNTDTTIGLNDYVANSNNLLIFTQIGPKGFAHQTAEIILSCDFVYLYFPSLPFFHVVAYSENGCADFHNLYPNQRGITERRTFWGYEDRNIVWG